MRGSRNFRGGGSRSICHKNPWQHVFLVPIFSRTPLILQNANVYFKENYNFPRFQWCSNIFSRGGVQLFLGGGGGGGGFQLLIPYWIPYNLCFSRGVRAPSPPLPSRSVPAKLAMRKSYQFWPPLPWVFLNVYMVSGKTTIVAWPGSKLFLNFLMGAQWLSGRVLDSRPKGHRFEPHLCHCVVVLEQDISILA